MEKGGEGLEYIVLSREEAATAREKGAVRLGLEIWRS